MKGLLVSIIIPAYNSGKYLRECLDSVINQTYKNWETIVVLAPSIDNTLDVLREYSRDPRIKIIQEKTKSNCATARNRGYEASKVQYVKFLDSDDWLEPDCLQAFVNTFEMYCDPSILWCVSYEVTHRDGKEIPIREIPGTHIEIGGIGGIMFRRECLERVKKVWSYLFLESLGHTDDGDLSLRLIHYPVKLIPVVLSHYRWHDENLTSQTDPIEQEWGIVKMIIRNGAWRLLPYHLKNLILIGLNNLTGYDLVKTKKEFLG